MCEKILLIDGHSILNRAFYGLPDLTNSEGLHTGAVYGFLNILFKVLGEEKPEYLAVAFDRSEPTFRHAKYPEYKGTRKPMPQELKEQIPLLKEMLEKMGIATVSLAGFEADDILGTLAKNGEEKGLDVIILSGDRDLLQLATKKTMIRLPRTAKGQTVIEDYKEDQVQERYLVSPAQIIELKALMGGSCRQYSWNSRCGREDSYQAACRIWLHRKCFFTCGRDFTKAGQRIFEGKLPDGPAE